MVVLRKEQYDSMLYSIRHHAQTTPLPPLKGEVARRAGGVTPSALPRRTHSIATERHALRVKTSSVTPFGRATFSYAEKA